MEKFSIFAATESVLKPFLSTEEFNSTFDIFYIESSAELLEKIQTKIPSVIVIDEDFLFKNQDLIKNIQEKTFLLNSIDDKISLKIPVIGIMKEINLNVQKKFYELGALECFPQSTPPENLFAIINHIINHVSEEEQHISSLHELQKNTIKQLVRLDKKTGVYNKQTFLNKTQTMLEKNPDKQYYLVLVNLDRFKVFNDLFGFSAGDKILEKIGEHLNSTISEFSTYGHIYADQFVVCTPAVSNEILFMILGKVDAYVKSLHPKFDFICRYGIYVITNPKTDVSLAIDRAELAVASIKQNFTERFAFYNESMIENLKDEQELITDMVVGLQRNEFTVYLQPQYDYTTESLVGAEALVRWNHPTKGLISPAIFVPVFERNGFITQLDLFIWEKTCQLLRKWKGMGLNPIPVSVNISRRDIYNQNLVQIFNGLLKKYNLTPDLLRLEITESAYMENPTQLIQVVEDLHDNGFCLEMDDFGSGYSSLNTLKEVPVNVLKLDMKFIASDTKDLKDGKNNTKGGNILSSVIRMANWLHLPVIAEGIESKEQADYLKSIGCFYMQGYYFARPLPIEKYEELLTNLSPVNFEKNQKDAELEAAKFLDATEHSTLFFNNFIGGAAIIEWSGETVEALRMNDQFFEEIGTTRHDFTKIQKDIVSGIEKYSQETFFSTLYEAINSKKSSFCEIQLKPFYENTQPFWVRIHLRHIGKTVTSNIYYLTVENIDFRMKLLQLKTNLSEQLSSIIENVPCGIFSISFDEKVKLSYSNKNVAKILGYSQQDFDKLLEKNPFESFLKTEKDSIMQIIRTVKQNEAKEFSKEAAVFCSDGTTKNVHFYGEICNQADGMITANILMMDFSEK